MAGLDSGLGKIAGFLTWSMMIVVINDMTASVCFGAVWRSSATLEGERFHGQAESDPDTGIMTSLCICDKNPTRVSFC